MAARPGLIAMTFLTFSLLTLNRIHETWQEASTQRPLPLSTGKHRWPSWPLIGGDISLLPLHGIKRNLPGSKYSEDLTKLYPGNLKTKMAALASDCPRPFWIFLCNRWTEFTETWQEASTQSPLTSLFFSGQSEDSPSSDILIVEQNLTKLDRKQNLNILYQVRYSGAQSLASWLLCNQFTNFGKMTRSKF